MGVSTEEKKAEAVKRMKALKIINDAVKQFQKEDVVMVSEPPFGSLYVLSDEQKELVSSFEKEHNALVYLVVRSYTAFGTMDSFLYVSDYEEEWEQDNQDVSEGYPLTYTHNYDAPHCSEFGTVGVSARFGGLIRTA